MQQNPNKIRRKYANWPILNVKSGQNEYPLKLAEIPDKPAALFYRGAIPADSLNIAIVGSRKISDYGAAALKHIFNNLNDSRVCIVSGLAYGIDAEAHKMALKNGLRTVAVLGTPIEHIYPSAHASLAEQILDAGGSVISEARTAGNENKTAKWSFAQRNRIIAGLCDATVIIEAAENSGALITAAYARKYCRKVFAVPGSIFAENCAGANGLLADGALPLTSLNDLLREFPHIKNTAVVPQIGGMQSDNKEIGQDPQTILSLISKENMSAAQIATQSSLTAIRIGIALSMLEIHGKITKLPNGKYIRSVD